MNLGMLLALTFILWLLAMLYVGPTYFRRLGQLIKRLESHHSSEFERLGQPSLEMLSMTMGSTMAVVWYVIRKDYIRLSDAEVTRLGNSTRIRLLFSITGPLIMLVLLPIAASHG